MRFVILYFHINYKLKYITRKVIFVDELNISLRLAMLRTKKNVSAREMSLAIGQNPNYINHIETKNAVPSLIGLSYICDYLGITMSDFFDFNSTNPAKLKTIMEYLNQLDDEQLDIIENLLKHLVNK